MIPYEHESLILQFFITTIFFYLTQHPRGLTMVKAREASATERV